MSITVVINKQKLHSIFVTYYSHFCLIFLGCFGLALWIVLEPIFALYHIPYMVYHISLQVRPALLCCAAAVAAAGSSVSCRLCQQVIFCCQAERRYALFVLQVEKIQMTWSRQRQGISILLILYLVKKLQAYNGFPLSPRHKCIDPPNSWIVLTNTKISCARNGWWPVVFLRFPQSFCWRYIHQTSIL